MCLYLRDSAGTRKLYSFSPHQFRFAKTDWKYRKRIVIDHTKVSYNDLRNFPVLISLETTDLKSIEHGGYVTQASGEDICFMDAKGKKQLAHETEIYNPSTGELKVWVKIPLLSCTTDTVLYMYYGNSKCASQQSSSKVWDRHYSLVAHLNKKSFDGEKDYLKIPHNEGLNIKRQITVEAWLYSDSPRAEALQALVSEWSPISNFNKFEAYEAGNTSDLDSKGFLGAVFDGRYVYYVPQSNTTRQANGQRRHGIALRYDTHGKFKNSKNWVAYDASGTSGLTTKGYYGAVFDGRYVYYVPRFDGSNYHSRVLRYDTRGKFSDSKNWMAYDAGLPISYQSAGFDGRYVYFAPGASHDEKISNKIVLRYDTRSNFRDSASWETYNCGNTSGLKTENFDGVVFDGTYIYFVPLDNRVILQYDTRGKFTAGENWTAFNADSFKMKQCVGAVFDGRYIYFVPYAHTVVVRYDTRGGFTDDSNWLSYDAANTNGLNTKGYDGAVFDGRYVYFVPFYEGGGSSPEHFHGIVLRYDVTREFTDKKSWSACDAGNTDGLNTKGYNGAAFDGRYIYFAPWNRGEGEGYNIAGHGSALRYDTIGENGSFSLRYTDCGHNGGLCAAVPGPTFIVNTLKGVISIRANRIPEPGWHHIVGVYDGKSIRMYVDGRLMNQQKGKGCTIQTNNLDIGIGRILHGQGYFHGVIDQVRISNNARSSGWIATTHANMSSPETFYEVAEEEYKQKIT